MAKVANVVVDSIKTKPCRASLKFSSYSSTIVNVTTLPAFRHCVTYPYSFSSPFSYSYPFFPLLQKCVPHLGTDQGIGFPFPFTFLPVISGTRYRFVSSSCNYDGNDVVVVAVNVDDTFDTNIRRTCILSGLLIPFSHSALPLGPCYCRTVR